MIDEAKFHSIIRNTDSGWYRTDFFMNLKKLQMAGLYEDKECTMRNGTFYWFYPDGALKTAGRYLHNKKAGVWLDYFQDRSLKDSLNFADGNPAGISLGWYSNGGARDSLNMDADGKGVYVSWFDNGNPASAGKYIDFNKQQGKWQYFHKNGKLSSLEIYEHGVLKDKNYFDENGNPLSDTTNNDMEAEFPGGEKAWSKYLSKSIYFPSGYEFKTGYQAVVVVTGTINDEGKVIDVEVTAPLYPPFDKISMAALKDSPSWQPAISHNRKVYDTVTLPVHFGQQYLIVN